jgi:hypothetical protein
MKPVSTEVAVGSRLTGFRSGSIDDLTKIGTMEIFPRIDKVPTWDPVDEFSFPVADLPVKNFIDDSLKLDNFKEVKVNCILALKYL